MQHKYNAPSAIHFWCTNLCLEEYDTYFLRLWGVLVLEFKTQECTISVEAIIMLSNKNTEESWGVQKWYYLRSLCGVTSQVLISVTEDDLSSGTLYHVVEIYHNLRGWSWLHLVSWSKAQLISRSKCVGVLVYVSFPSRSTLENLHHSPASCRRQQNGNLVLGGVWVHYYCATLSLGEGAINSGALPFILGFETCSVKKFTVAESK